jgi:uncharacterized protein GlcG (DUF336 family)
MDKTSSQLRSISNITAEAALNAISVAFTEAKKAEVNISVAVVDTSLNLIAFSKGDGATPHSAETSQRKANTSASTGKATGWMDFNLAVTLPMASGNLLTNIPGGVPLRFNGVLGGGLGIAGGTVDQDDAISKATLVAIGADTI